MLKQLGAVLVAGGIWVGAGGGVCFAQSAPPDPAPCTVAPQPAPCGAANAPAIKPSAAQKFPFPGEGGDSSGSPSVPAANGSSGGDGSQAPGGQQTRGGAGAGGARTSGGAFPFPEEDEKPAAKGGASSSGGSSSSSDDANAPDAQPGAAGGSTPGSGPGLEDKGSEGSNATPGRHLLHRVNPIGTKLQSNDEREAEDLDVAHFYIERGNLQGAYLRSQDAVKTAPDDPDAHFALAEAALKLGKRDEALAEYSACLKLDPEDKEAKAARKELAKLKP